MDVQLQQVRKSEKTSGSSSSLRSSRLDHRRSLMEGCPSSFGRNSPVITFCNYMYPTTLSRKVSLSRKNKRCKRDVPEVYDELHNANGITHVSCPTPKANRLPRYRRSQQSTSPHIYATSVADNVCRVAMCMMYIPRHDSRGGYTGTFLLASDIIDRIAPAPSYDHLAMIARRSRYLVRGASSASSTRSSLALG